MSPKIPFLFQYLKRDKFALYRIRMQRLVSGLILVPFWTGLELRQHCFQTGEQSAYVPKSCGLFLQSVIAQAKLTLLLICQGSR